MDNNFFVLLTANKLGTVLTGEPMSKHTSFHIGGPADILFIPNSAASLRKALLLAANAAVPVTVIGNGTNLLVRDKGIRGMVIKLGNALCDYRVEEDSSLTFGSGLSLAFAAHVALETGLTGMEFAAGIPGSLGGAVYMNAGAYGGEMKDIVILVKVMDKKGKIKAFPVSELAL